PGREGGKAPARWGPAGEGAGRAAALLGKQDALRRAFPTELLVGNALRGVPFVFVFGSRPPTRGANVGRCFPRWRVGLQSPRWRLGLVGAQCACEAIEKNPARSALLLPH